MEHWIKENLKNCLIVEYDKFLTLRSCLIHTNWPELFTLFLD